MLGFDSVGKSFDCKVPQATDFVKTSISTSLQHHLEDIPPLTPDQTHRKHMKTSCTPTGKVVTELKIFDDFLHNRSPESQWMTSTAEIGKR